MLYRATTHEFSLNTQHDCDYHPVFKAVLMRLPWLIFNGH